MSDQPVARGRLVARDAVKLLAEAFEMKQKKSSKRFLWQSRNGTSKQCLKLLAVFFNGDVHYVIVSFCKNVLKTATLWSTL